MARPFVLCNDNCPDVQGKQKSLADKFEYVMHGLQYKISEVEDKVYVHASPLLMKLLLLFSDCIEWEFLYLLYSKVNVHQHWSFSLRNLVKTASVT